MATILLRESGGDYATLNACLDNASPGDEIIADQAWTGPDIQSAICAVDNITFRCIGAARHPGWDDPNGTHYKLSVSDGNHALQLNGEFSMTIEGATIEQAGTGASDEGFRCVPNVGKTVTITDCVFHCSTNTDQQDCLYLGYSTDIGRVTVIQSIFTGAGRAGINCENGVSAGTLDVNSCTLWNNGNTTGGGGGVRYFTQNNGSTFDISVFNTISMGNDGASGSADYIGETAILWGPRTFTVAYSIDSDNSLNDGFITNDVGNLVLHNITDDNTKASDGDWVIVEDITSAPFDLRLQSNDFNEAQDMHSQGGPIYGMSIPQNDIVGTARPQNTSYDCGPFEIPSGAPPAGKVPVLLRKGRVGASGSLGVH